MFKPLQNKKYCCYFEYLIFSVTVFAILTVIHSWLSYDDVSLVNFIVPVFAGLIVGFLMARNKILQLQLSTLANTDKLTGAYNRQYFDHRLEEEIDRAKRYKFPLSVIYLDLDHFKRVNDQHGHKTGDSVLIDFSDISRKVIRDSDIFTRFGGEEFIILAQMADSESSQRLYQRLQQAVAEHSFQMVNNITFSAGIAELNLQDDSVESLLDRADKALYRAKENGRNQAVIAD